MHSVGKLILKSFKYIKTTFLLKCVREFKVLMSF